MKITLDLPQNASKAQEIAALRNLTLSLEGTDLYLSSLFTGDLYDWVVRHINADQLPSLFLEFIEVGDTALSLNSRRLDLERFSAALQRKVETLQIEVDELRATISQNPWSEFEARENALKAEVKAERMRRVAAEEKLRSIAAAVKGVDV